MLKGEQLGFRYHRRGPWVVRDFGLTLSPGEVVGLRGVSGRGKTTIARLLAGLLPPAEGQVLLDGAHLPQRDFCPVQIVLQHPELAINPRWRIGKVLDEGQRPTAALLAALCIDPAWRSRWPHELSGGELQRIAVARALAAPTRYLIADEMTAMLDAVTQAQIWQVVLAVVQQRQLGVLVISHEMSLLQRLCTQVIDLDS
jgi:peptide/nickel transport system ATP-binding protein/Fe3+-transporting ATPase